jgi:uncharacterized protein YndB with AHSA1/START domain
MKRCVVRSIRIGGTIRRPVGEVFAVLSDPENAPKWSPNALEEELTSPRPVQVGSTRRAVVKTLGRGTAENHAVCTAFEPNRRIAWRSISAPVPFEVTVDFTPIDGATRIDSVWTWEPRGLLRPVAPLLDLMFSRAMQQDVDGLRRKMEVGDL